MDPVDAPLVGDFRAVGAGVEPSEGAAESRVFCARLLDLSVELGNLVNGEARASHIADLSGPCMLHPS
jgi:hypothetical protein